MLDRICTEHLNFCKIRRSKGRNHTQLHQQSSFRLFISLKWMLLLLLLQNPCYFCHDTPWHSQIRFVCIYILVDEGGGGIVYGMLCSLLLWSFSSLSPFFSFLSSFYKFVLIWWMRVFCVTATVFDWDNERFIFRIYNTWLIPRSIHSKTNVKMHGRQRWRRRRRRRREIWHIFVSSDPPSADDDHKCTQFKTRFSLIIVFMTLRNDIC